MVRAILIPQSLILRISLVSILVLPTLLQGIVDKADKWGNGGKNGIIDPFSEVYDVSIFATYAPFCTKFPLSARFRPDRPNGHMSRPGEERG